MAVQDLKKQPLQDVARRVEEIWQEFLAPGAPSAINLDSHSYEITSQNVKDGGRYTFEDAQVCSSHQIVLSRDVHVSTPPPHSLNTHPRLYVVIISAFIYEAINGDHSRWMRRAVPGGLLS